MVNAKALKQHLHASGGPPRFRQRLLHQGEVLDDDACLHADMSIQMVVLPFVARNDDWLQQENEMFSVIVDGTAGFEKLLNLPVDPDFRVHGLFVNTTFLHCAAEKGYDEIVRLLAEAEANINLKDDTRRTKYRQPTTSSSGNYDAACFAVFCVPERCLVQFRTLESV